MPASQGTWAASPSESHSITRRRSAARRSLAFRGAAPAEEATDDSSASSWPGDGASTAPSDLSSSRRRTCSAGTCAKAPQGSSSVQYCQHETQDTKSGKPSSLTMRQAEMTHNRRNVPRCQRCKGSSCRYIVPYELTIQWVQTCFNRFKCVLVICL